MDRQLAETLYIQENGRRTEILISGTIIYIVWFSSMLLCTLALSEAENISIVIAIPAFLSSLCYTLGLYSIILALWPRDYMHSPLAKTIAGYYKELIEYNEEHQLATTDDWLIKLFSDAAHYNGKVNSTRKHHIANAIKRTLVGIILSILAYVIHGIINLRG